MRRDLRLHPFFRLTFAAAALLSMQCGERPQSTTWTNVTILTGGTGGAFFPLGSDLAELYSQQIAGVQATAISTVASVFNVQAVQAGRGDVAFAQADVAYLAYRRGLDSGEQPYLHLRSIAVLYVNTVQIIARRASGIRSVADFRARRVGVGGEPGSGTETAARTVIESYGLSYSDLQPRFLSFSELAGLMEKNELDAGIVVASFPISAIAEIDDAADVRLIAVDAAAVHRIRSLYPFFKPVIIPRGTYRGQQDDVQTVGVDNLLLCRDNLSEELVYRMTRVFFESLPRLASSHSSARMIDQDQAPATPIPLHAGASRYYRERELIQ